MVYLIPKLEMPVVQYTPVKYKEDVAMLAITQNGPVILFTATDELIFVPYDEIIEFAVGSKSKLVIISCKNIFTICLPLSSFRVEALSEPVVNIGIERIKCNG